MKEKIEKERFLKSIKRINKGLSNNSIKVILKAFSYAFNAHKNQKRTSGEAYIIHPIDVALKVAAWKSDESTIVSALLHDVVEDTEITVDDIKQEFGEKVAQIVDGLTKITHIKTDIQSVKNMENYRKLIFALSKDFRVIIVKFADRLHNLKTLHYLRKDKQKRIAAESLEIYAPLANRLGMNNVKSEIEDLSFKYLYKDDYYRLKDLVGEKKKLREDVVNFEINNLRFVLNKLRISFEIYGRAKHFYSIFQKLKRGKKFKDIFDINGIRILTDSVENCYKILGLIHQVSKPIAERFKDYIAIPKFNNYQSLHTTYINDNGKFIEVQIRTYKMNYIAEYGIAAHFAYKENKEELNEFDKQMSLLREIISLGDVDPDDAFVKFKKELFKNEIYVFTPNGEIKFLPSGSTLLDFAFYIHSDIGIHCRAGTVDGKFVPISYILKNGDTIRIETSVTVKPVDEWLNIAKSIKALTKIRNYLKRTNRDEYILKGKLILKNYYKDLNCSSSYEHSLNEFLKKSDNLKIDELYYKIGSNSMKKERVFSSLVKNTASINNKKVSKKVNKNSIIEIEGIKNFAYNLAKCCNPVPGDDIIGLLSKKKTVTIHNAKCKNIVEALKKSHTIKLIANWTVENQSTRTRLEIDSVDVMDSLNDIDNIFSANNSKINKLSYRNIKNKHVHIIIDCEVKNKDHLNVIIGKLKKVNNISYVKRILK